MLTELNNSCLVCLAYLVCLVSVLYSIRLLLDILGARIEIFMDQEPSLDTLYPDAGFLLNMIVRRHALLNVPVCTVLKEFSEAIEIVAEQMSIAHESLFPKNVVQPLVLPLKILFHALIEVRALYYKLSSPHQYPIPFL